MIYKEAITYLENLQKFGDKPGLHRMEKIAFEKAGIIKSNSTVITGEHDAKILEIFNNEF